MALRKKCGGPRYENNEQRGCACGDTGPHKMNSRPSVWRHWTSMKGVAAICGDTRPHTMNNNPRVWRHSSPYNDNSGCVCGDTGTHGQSVRVYGDTGRHH